MPDQVETEPKMTAEAVVASQVRALRERRGWSQADLAGHAGMLQQTVARLEKGKRRVTVDDLFSLAAALDVAPVELLAASFEPCEVPVTTAVHLSPSETRAWVCGVKALPSGDERLYYNQKPGGEQTFHKSGYANLALASHDMEEWREAAISENLDQEEFAIRRLAERTQNAIRDLQTYRSREYFEPGRAAQRKQVWGDD
jgi:transcriptional regulator with XRE-family HTH domain